MRKEVISYYSAMNIPVERMVDVGTRRKLTAASVRQAAEEVYDELNMPYSSNGYVEPIRVAWLVYGRAKHVAIKHREDGNKAIVQINERLGRIEEMITPWYKKLWRKFNDNR